MASKYAAPAAAAVKTLTTNWFNLGTFPNWVPMDYWKTPTICIELCEYMAFAKDNSYMPLLNAALSAGNCCFTWCGYYDDLTCWGIFAARTYEYLTSIGADAGPFEGAAETILGNLKQAYDSTCNGGIWWQRNPKSYPGNFKASNSTLGYMQIALEIYQVTGDGALLTTAASVWDWVASHGFVDTKGMVWGGLTSNCTVDPGNPPVVALQGNPLRPLWLMYKASNETKYLDVAQSIIDGTMANFVWPGTQILQAKADALWNSSDQAYKEKEAGETPFKGIFISYLGDFAMNLATVDDPARQKAAATYAAFIAANADSLLANFPGGMYGMNWNASSPDYQANPDVQINACLQYGGVSALLAAAQTNP